MFMRNRYNILFSLFWASLVLVGIETQAQENLKFAPNDIPVPWYSQKITGCPYTHCSLASSLMVFDYFKGMTADAQRTSSDADNCGAEESFNKLCQYSLQQDLTDYYAFCDQDDVWDNDKLSIAIQSLEKFDHLVPNLYFSNLRMVDDTLSYIRDFYNEKEVDIDNKLSLVQIFTYGCTCVFNQSALSIYCKVNNKSFHDNWIYIICSFMGNVFYDSSAHIQYRQHNSNLSGHKTTGLGLLRSRLYRPFKGNLGHDFEFLAIQLLQVSFENTLSDKYKIARNIANYRTNIISRLFLFFSPSYCTGNFVKDLCIRYRILFNCL